MSAGDRQREFGSSDSFASCPLKGLRGPALAAGDHLHILQDLAQMSQDRLEQKDRVFLRLEDWEEVVGDMNTLIAAIDAILRTKTSCWGTLPYVLTGLSHPDEEKARSCAVKAVELWESTPAAARPTLDNTSILFLSGDGGQSIREFASGAIARDGLPRNIKMEIAKLRFIPVCERIIERQHSLINKAGGRGKMGPLKASLAIRATALFERSIVKNPDILEKFIKHFDVARDVRHYPGKGFACAVHAPAIKHL